MAVRPFFINVKVSGRKEEISTGPKSRFGTIDTAIYQRDRGEITTPFKIVQKSIEVFNEDTKKYELELRTEVYYQGELIKTHTTDY